VDTLDGLQRYWGQFPKNNEAAKGPRGENIYEFWYPDDWYQAEAIRNPDYMEKLKLMLPAKLFAGTVYAEGEREVIGNFAAKIMPWLPRYAPTADGKILPVDSMTGVDIEVGKEYYGSLEFENAPFGLAVVASGKQGTILSRPPLTESGAGFPIMPITGDSGWRIRNDYDKDCNKDLNQPYSEKDYEMGIRMDDPQAALAFLFRRRVFQTRPINECDLAPIFLTTGNEIDCPITTIGCGDNQNRMNDNVVGQTNVRYVECTSAACGNSTERGAPYHYILKIARRAGEPDYNSLGCECGDTVNLYVYDEDGAYVEQIQGVYKSDVMSFPYARYFIETQVALGAGQCIKGVSCADADADSGNVLDAFPISEGVKGFILDDSLASCDEEGTVDVKYYDADDVLLGTVEGVVDSFDIETFYYQISSVDPLFSTDGTYDGTAYSYIIVTCTESE